MRARAAHGRAPASSAVAPRRCECRHRHRVSVCRSAPRPASARSVRADFAASRYRGRFPKRAFVRPTRRQAELSGNVEVRRRRAGIDVPDRGKPCVALAPSLATWTPFPGDPSRCRLSSILGCGSTPSRQTGSRSSPGRGPRIRELPPFLPGRDACEPDQLPRARATIFHTRPWRPVGVKLPVMA